MAEKDIAPEMWERILRLYRSGINADKEIARLNKILNKTYDDAQKYAIKVGQNASRALGSVLTPEALPGGRMYYNIAERTVRPMLKEVYKTVVDYCEEAQLSINEAAELGIKAIKPKINDSRIRGIIDRMTAENEFAKIAWIMDAPVVNFSQAVVDDSVIENARFANGAGVKAKIVRTTDGKCCEWCDKLAGRYDYPVDNKEVYMRHDNCTCVLTYYPASGASSQRAWGTRVGGLTRRTEKRLNNT